MRASPRNNPEGEQSGKAGSGPLDVPVETLSKPFQKQDPPENPRSDPDPERKV